MARLFFKPVSVLLDLHQKAGQTHAQVNPITNPIGRGTVRPVIDTNKLRQANSGIIADPAFRNLVHHASPINAPLFMETCMLGHFVADTRAGRDMYCAAFLVHIDKTKSRHGLDGLFLTVLSHLAHTRSASLTKGLQLWAATASTAGKGKTAFDTNTNTLSVLAASAFDPKIDPFKGGVQGPAFQQHLSALQGGDLMDCSPGSFAAAGTVVGLIVGAIVTKTPAGAKAGAEVGGMTGGVVGEVYCGWADSKPSNDVEGSGNKGVDTHTDVEHPEEHPEEHPDEQPEEHPEEHPDDPNKPDGGGGWPNSSGFPAPDDGGGGNPWSSIAVPSLMTLSQASHLLVAQAGGGFSTKALAPLNVGNVAMDQTASLTQQIATVMTGTMAGGNIVSGKSIVSAEKMQGLANALKANGIDAKQVVGL